MSELYRNVQLTTDAQIFRIEKVKIIAIRIIRFAPFPTTTCEIQVKVFLSYAPEAAQDGRTCHQSTRSVC